MRAAGHPARPGIRRAPSGVSWVMELGRRELLVWGGVSAATTGGWVRPVGASPSAAEQVEPAGPAPAVRRSALVRIGVDGAIRWQTPVALGPDEFGSQVAVGRGRVFLAQDGALRSYDVTSGRPAWAAPMAGIMWQLLAVDGLVLVVGSSKLRRDLRVAAYDQDTGRHRWTHTSSADAIVLYPIRAGLVAAQQRFTTVALDTATGRVRWTAPVPGHDDGGSCFTQLATSPTVLVQGRLVTTAALDASTGRRLWQRSLAQSAPTAVLTGSVAVLTSLSVGGPTPGGVVAVDARTGAPRWGLASAEQPAAVVAAGYGVVVAVTGSTEARGRTTAVATETGRVLWSTAAPASSDSISATAITAHAVAYIEDYWRASSHHPHRSISLVNRRLSDGRVLYRRPTAQPTAQGTAPHLTGRYLPLVLHPGGRGPISVRLFDLATHQVRYTVPVPHWPTTTPPVLTDGSVITHTAELPAGMPL